MIRKAYKFILSLLAVLCVIVSLSPAAFAADVPLLKINNVEVNEISISGSHDGITSANNSYKITAKDTSYTVIMWTRWKKQTRTMTFTNNFNGWVKITYTIDGNGTLSAVDGNTCSIADGVITLQKGGQFKIAVTSSNNSAGESQASKTSEFKPTNIEYEKLTPEISFEAPSEFGSFTVTDEAGSSVSVPGSSKSSSYTLTAKPDSGYELCCWIFTNSSGAKTYFGTKTATIPYTASEAGSITCVFMPSGSAVYSVDGVQYPYLDQAIETAKTSSDGRIVVVGSGDVRGSTGQTGFTIPNGVTMVLPYKAGQTYVYGSDTSSNDYFPYGNYDQGTGYSAQPGSLTASKYLELTIPSGITVTNNGTISVGGTLQGNAAMSGAHSNLKVDGTLELKSSTSVLSAIGYVYGNGDVIANGSGAKIFQPLSLFRNGSWGWAVGCAGRSMGSSYGMQTWPSDGYSGINPSPRYATQNIQCDLVMKTGDTMYGYADQYSAGVHYMCTVVLVGTDSSNSLIALGSGATLNSTYSSNTSSLYTAIGKLTLEISGGATQGTMALAMAGYELSLSKWDFPVPYNYDVILKNGDYALTNDLSLLPGAGLKVENATLKVPAGVHLAVYTAANDHSSTPTAYQDNSIFNQGTYATKTVSYNNGKPVSPNYPANSTLSNVSGGSMMANLMIAGDGVLNVESGGYFGGIVQTSGGGTVIMNGVTSNASGKDYVFTRQLGLAGNCNEANPLDYDTWAHAGATIYKFYPQYFDENGVLQTMVSGTTYKAANTTTNTVETFTFDFYPTSGTTSVVDAAKQTKTETINAKPVGQWYVPATVTFEANSGEGTMEAMEVHSGVAFTLPANAFTRSGFDFKGWNTKADGTGDNYDDAAEITVTADITLYAQWEEKTCAHTVEQAGEAVDATCETVGYMPYWQCTLCEAYFSDETSQQEIENLTEWLDTEGDNGGKLPATGHKYTVAEDGYAWAKDYSKATATGTCQNDPTHTATLDSEASTKVETKPTCTKGGSIVYTANFAENPEWTNLEEQTEPVILEIDSTAHDMQETTAAVAPSCETAGSTAVYTCANGCGKTEGGEAVDAIGHNMQETAAAVAPTCEKAGTTAVYTCANGCGKTEGGEAVDAIGHDMQETAAAVAPGCETAGSTAVYTCANGCGKTEGSEAVDAIGHDMQETTAAAAPTCETAGSTAVYTCANGCGKTEGGDVIDALGHSYEAVVTPPTFDAQGYTTHTCSACENSYVDTYVDALLAVAQIGEQKYQTLPAAVAAAKAGDTVTLLADVALTERLTISKVLTLDLADKTITADFTDDFGPIYIGTQGNLTVTGNGTVVSEKDIVFANYGQITVESGTFRSNAGEGGYNAALYNMYYNGEKYGKAVINGGTFQSPVWNSGVLTVENGTLNGIDNSGKATITGGTVNGEIIVSSDAPELTEKGTFEISGGKFQNAVEKEWCAEGYGPNANADGTYGVHQHIEREAEKENNVDATCTTGGSYDTVVRCTKCNEILSSEHTTVDKLGHDMKETAAKVDPKCEVAGTEAIYTCANGCGKTTGGEAIPALEHDMQLTAEKVDPKCEVAGTEAIYTCANGCGKTTGGEAIPALEHDMQLTAEKVEAKCEVPGKEAIYTCANGCGKTEGGEAIPALEHDMQLTAEKVDPKCEVPGTEAVYTCAHNCGETTGGEAIPALEHDMQLTSAKVEPKCEVAGKEAIYTCANGCGKTTGGEKIDALGHKNTETINAKEATCGANGYTGDTVCNDCGETTEYGKPIPATGEHNWDEGEETLPPTTAAPGVMTYTCSSCGDTKTEPIEQLKGYVVTLDDRTIDGNNKAYTSLVDGQRYVPGDTFTVKCAMACVVAISTNDRETYDELTCVAVEGEENTYQFTIPTDVTADFWIGIVLRGDARGDGNVKQNDATRILRYLTDDATTNNTLDSLTYLAADARGDGSVKQNDATRILRYLTDDATTNNTLSWNMKK